MGPTCAQRAGVQAGEEAEWQLSFLDGLGAYSKPLPPKSRSKTPKRTLPPELHESYVMAKIAFDELYREFHGNGTLLHNESARELEREILSQPCEIHSLADPVLGWLEPEHQLQLMIDAENQMTYYRRELNGVVTMLEIEPAASLAIKRYVQDITSFTKAMRLHHAGPQLSLLDFGPDLSE